MAIKTIAMFSSATKTKNKKKKQANNNNKNQPTNQPHYQSQ